MYEGLFAAVDGVSGGLAGACRACCTTDKKKLEELKKHAERWLAAYEGAELYRKVENQAPDAAHIPQEDGDELEDGDLEVEIVSDDSDDEQ